MKQEVARRIVLRLGTMGGLTVTTLMLLATWSHLTLFSPLAPAVEGAFRESNLESPIDTEDGFEPFVSVIPDEDGTSSLIFVTGIEDTTAVITIKVDIEIVEGGGNHRVGYTPPYSTAEEAFVITDTGLDPDETYAGTITVCSESGQNLPDIGYVRGRFEAEDTFEKTFSYDGVLEIGLIIEPFPTDTYVAIVDNPSPPSLALDGYRAVSHHYSLRTSQAAPTTTVPLELVFHYEQFAVDDPSMLSIFWWNPSTRAWVDVDESLVEIDSTLTVFTNNLGVYTIMAPEPPEEEEKLYLPIIIK